MMHSDHNAMAYPEGSQRGVSSVANYTIDETPVTDDWGNMSFPGDEGAIYNDDGGATTHHDDPDANVAVAPNNPFVIDDTDDDDVHVPAEYYENEHPHEEEAFEDPYADTPYPTNDDPYENTPYASHLDGGYVHDPFGELDYSQNGAAADMDDLEDIEMSKKENLENIQGGEYEIESKDAKFDGMQAFMMKYGKAIAAFASATCLSIIVVGITIAITNASASNTSLENSPWGLRKDAVHTGKFVPPPLELESICTQENIATSTGFDACASLCEPAQCCRFDPLEAPHMSCQTGHIQDCHTYHHYCERPPKAAIVPFAPPPDNIQDICTAEKIETPEGVTECARACLGGTCCRYPTTLAGLSCLRGNEGQCQVYHQYCEQPPPSSSSLSSSENAHPLPGNGGQATFPFVNPPDDIQERCSGKRVASAEGFEECLEICRGGTCCRFDADREPNLSCRNQQPVECPIYDQYCGGNTNVISEQTVHPDGGSGISGNQQQQNNDNDNNNDYWSNSNSVQANPTYVELSCSDHSLATVEGFADCQKACDDAKCCWKKEFGTTCPVWAHCEPYAHCLALEASDHIDVAIQVSINLKCTDAQIATQEGRRACLLACSQATCCFGNTGGECPHEQDSFCNQYEACEKVLQNNTTPIPPAPLALAQHCSPGSLESLEGLVLCDSDCAPADCCWKTTGTPLTTCEKTNPLCADYAACGVLESATATTYPPIPTAPATLEDVCTPFLLQNATDAGVKACEDACDGGNCCWNTGGCLYQQPDQCLGYAACAVLLGEVPDAPDSLAILCTADKVSTDSGAAACQALCDEGTCCWKTGACLHTQVERCQGYKPCSVLQMADDAPGPPIASAPDALADYCTSEAIAGEIQATGVSLCEDVCQPAECCWKTGTCVSTQADKCMKYAPCTILAQDSGTPSSPPLPAAQSFLADVCTAQNVANVEGAIICRDACTPGECCWKTKTCLGVHATECEGYAPCSLLMDDSSDPGESATSAVVPQVPAYLETVCDSEIGGDDVHGHLCVNACQRASCCWEGDKPCASNPNCSGYEICSLVNMETITPAPVTTPAPVPGTTPAPTPSPATPAPGTSAAPAPEYTEEMITDACLNHDNSIVNLCERICDGSDCCFHPDNHNGTNCGDFPCYKYNACAQLHPTVDDAVNEACINGELSDCIRLCGSSTCCFTQDIDKVCAVVNPGLICSRFTACERIYDIDFGG